MQSAEQKGECIMDYQQALLDLIAYCQREGVLTSDDTVVMELSDIFTWSESEVCELLY